MLDGLRAAQMKTAFSDKFISECDIQPSTVLVSTLVLSPVIDPRGRSPGLRLIRRKANQLFATVSSMVTISLAWLATEKTSTTNARFQGEKK
jgi:hypothetical protein